MFLFYLSVSGLPRPLQGLAMTLGRFLHSLRSVEMTSDIRSKGQVTFGRNDKSDSVKMTSDVRSKGQVTFGRNRLVA